ncbi:MAG: demethoxyubiquinone hydroxylase family protein, partial [Gammaproteobacteria bacterium]
MHNRQYDARDRLIMRFDQLLSNLPGRNTPVSPRPSPADNITELPLTEAERRESERLLRVNHAGEVCAQALYHAQALSSSDKMVRAVMERSAEEEGDHL